MEDIIIFRSATSNSTSINDVQILLALLKEHKHFEIASLKLIREMLSKPEYFIEDDLDNLKGHELNIQHSLDDTENTILLVTAKKNVLSINSDETDFLRVENFEVIRDTIHAQLAQSTLVYGAIKIKSYILKSYESSEIKLIEQAKCNYQIILSCINSLKIANFVTTDLYKSDAHNCIEAFLVDMATSDGNINITEVDLLNNIFSQNKFVNDYQKQYSDNGTRDNVANSVVSLILELGNYSHAVAQNTNICFYELVLNMIACDGTQDERELYKLSEYSELLNKKYNIEPNTTGIQSDNIAKDVIENKISEDETHSLDELLTELSNLIGLVSVKHEVNNLCNHVRVSKMREQANLPANKLSLHLVFTGNPGTGKTTIARLLAKIFNSLGLLSKGHLVEVGRSDLVGGYIGQTALKTSEVIERSLGGILFIDEAYSLVRTSTDSDYGSEAVETLLKVMEDKRENLIVIVAGYPVEMTQFINSNPGLKSRFSKYINFPDFNTIEMMKILHKMSIESSYNILPEAAIVFQKIINQLYTNKTEHFGNARSIRNLFEDVIQQHSNRIITIDNPSIEELQNIKEEDVLYFLKEENKNNIDTLILSNNN